MTEGFYKEYFNRTVTPECSGFVLKMPTCRVLSGTKNERKAYFLAAMFACSIGKEDIVDWNLLAEAFFS